MSQDNLNPYSPKEFEERFKTTDLYKTLTCDFNVVTFDHRFDYENITSTVREWYGSRNRTTIFSAVPFYYLEFLTKHNPDKIYDIGCGWNIFKKYIPNIIGIAGENVSDLHYNGDEHGFVDDQYIKQHHEYFESAFSINALHFFHLTNIRQQVLKIVSMIKPNGRLFLALNLARMKEVDPNFQNKSIEETEKWIRVQLDDMPFTYEVFDIELSKPDNWMDGNIRMVIWNKTT